MTVRMVTLCYVMLCSEATGRVRKTTKAVGQGKERIWCG